MKIEATFKDETLSITHDGEVIRTVNNPKHKGVYKFSIEGEECFSVFEDYTLRGLQITRLYLYPLNYFENNMIEL